MPVIRPDRRRPRRPARRAAPPPTRSMRPAPRERAGAGLDRRSSITPRSSTAVDVAPRLAVAARPRSPRESRPPMKRADGHRLAAGIDVDQRVARRVERDRPAADRHRDHPGAGRDDGEGRRPGEEMRQQRGVGIVDAAKDRRRRVEAGRGGDLGQQRPEPVGGVRGAAASARVQPSALDQRREAARGGFQRSVWQPSEVTSVARDAGEPEGPVLRIGQDRRRVRARLGEARELPVELRAEIEPGRQPRRCRSRRRPAAPAS